MGENELAVTRRSLHGVAELVLAGPQYRATGKLRLGVVSGGFATILDPRLRVDGGQVAGATGAAVAIDGRTPRALGAELGVAAGRPEGAYEGGSGVDPGETLSLDADQAGVILGALALGHEALVAFAPAETPVLWPEHFDVAVAADQVTYGVAAGDDLHPLPYAYVAPFDVTAHRGPFFNAPFGALRSLDPTADVDALAAQIADFLAEGRGRLEGE